VADLEDENTGKGIIYRDIPLIKANIAQSLKANTGLSVHPVLQRHLASIRTDLDGFDPLEVRALVKHGYAVGRAQLLRYFHNNKADAEKTMVFAFRRNTTRSWDPLPSKTKKGRGERSSMNLTKQSAAAYINQLDKSKSRLWLRWSLFRQWELPVLLISAVMLVTGVFLMSGVDAKKETDRIATSDLDLKFKVVVETATRAAISERANLETQSLSDDASKLFVLAHHYGGVKSDAATLSETFGMALMKNFKETVVDLKRQLDDVSENIGVLMVRYLDKEAMERRLVASKIQIDVLKKERVLVNAGKSWTGSVGVTTGKIRGGSRQVFIGTVVPRLIDQVPGPEMEFAGIQTVDRPSIARIMFVQRPPFNEQSQRSQSFKNPDFFTLELNYDSSAKSLEGEFVDPNVGMAIGKIHLSWSRNDRSEASLTSRLPDDDPLHGGRE
jgi:hypothetical protein